MKSGLKLLFLFTILFCSCYENDVLITEVTEVVPQQEIELLTPKQQAGQDALIMSNLLADMMKAISLSAEVNLNPGERVAQTRNSCPTTFLISDGVYPDTFFIDFDNCDPSAVFDQRYSGAVMFILNGELDDPNICPLFSIKNSPVNPKFYLDLDGQSNEPVRGYRVEITNDIDFCLASQEDGKLKYDYTLDGEINLEQDKIAFDPVTTYPDGMKGCITLKNNNKDDITKPASFIDNTYCVSAKPTIIECKFADGRIELFCISTNPEGISYNIRCGCPQTGKLYIDSPANGNCDNIQSTDSFWFYDYIQNPGNSSCENSALDPDNVVQRIPCGQSF